MKLQKIISMILCAAMLLSSVLLGVSVSAADDLPFDDVPDTWYTDAVKCVYSEGIMKGKTSTSFDPTAKITRAEVVTAFSRVAIAKTAGMGEDLPFDDTVSGQWYSESVGWAAENGIVTGRGDGRFSPADNITRAELASILTKFVKYMGIDLPDNPKLDKFADEDTFDAWMTGPIDAVRKNGLMQGTDGKFNPRGNATRAEIAQVIKNLLPEVGRVSVVENGKSDYVIVAGETYAEAAERLQYQIEYTTGAKLDIVTKTTSDKAIFLGDTSVNTDGLGSDGFEIVLDGDKVYIDGESADGVYRGAVRFALTAVSGDDVRFTSKTAERETTEFPVKSLKINGNDISKYTVYYPANASKNTVLGANEIVKYIAMACGTELKTSASAPGNYAIIIEEKNVDVDGQFDNLDNFSVKSEGNNIRITGSAVRGAVYGCYDFLEKCIGCRFLWVDVDYVFPADEIDIKNVNYTEMPGYVYRRQYDLTSALNVKFRNVDLAERINIVGRAIHSFDYYDEGYSSQFENQPCLTSDDVYNTIMKNVRAELAKAVEPDMISLSVNDNSNYCECKNCKASNEKYGGVSGTVLAFVNRAAKDLEDEYPDVYIHTFAYGDTKKPPTDIVAHKNVVVQMCTDLSCGQHDYYSDCNANRNIKKMIDGWSEITEHIYMWDYRNETHFIYTDLTNGKTLRDFKVFAERGSLGVFMQHGKVNHGNLYELRCYLISKVLWDPFMSDEEYQSHIDDFLIGYYGEEAASLIRKAIETVEAAKLTACYGVTYSTFDGDIRGYSFVARQLYSDAVKSVDILNEALLLTESKAEFNYVSVASIPYKSCVLDNEYLKYGKGDDELDARLQNESRALQDIFKENEISCHGWGVPDFYDFNKAPHLWKELWEEQME